MRVQGNKCRNSHLMKQVNNERGFSGKGIMYGLIQQGTNKMLMNVTWTKVKEKGGKLLKELKGWQNTAQGLVKEYGTMANQTEWNKD